MPPDAVMEIIRHLQAEEAKRPNPQTPRRDGICTKRLLYLISSTTWKNNCWVALLLVHKFDRRSCGGDGFALSFLIRYRALNPFHRIRRHRARALTRVLNSNSR